MAINGCAIAVERDILVSSEFEIWHDFRDVEYGRSSIETVYAEIAQIGWRTDAASFQLLIDDSFWMRMKLKAATALLGLKDEGFREEQEVRLLVQRPYRYSGDHADPRYRLNAAGLIVPHLVIPINLAAIKEIWVAPGPYRDRNTETLGGWITALADDPYFTPRIRRSATPFQ